MTLVLAGAGFLIGNRISTELWKSNLVEYPKCPVKTEEVIVRGTSLDPLIKPGQTIKLYLDIIIVMRLKGAMLFFLIMLAIKTL